MSLSRSPSPGPNGGWSSPGLTDYRDRSSSPRQKQYDGMNGYAATDAYWAAAKAKSDQVRGQPSFQTRNEGFFQRSRRKISSTLPRFNSFALDRRDWRDAEKLGRGRWNPHRGGEWSKIKTLVGNLLRRFKVLFVLLTIIATLTIIMSETNMRTRYRRNARFGGGSKFVIILAANEGGGVMEWKGPREWAIERDSVKNKKMYAEMWGYDLEIADMATKKKYAHEWRESWEKVDMIRNAMVKYPNAEWFWWLDLNTYIMEPTYSLQSHIFNHLSTAVYRDINVYNPLDIPHPPQSPVLDPLYLSPTGDNKTSSIDLILSQDCLGFSLGSFFVRRSPWTDRLLDIWWDPVLYEQRHMQWEHKEQDALEHLYTNQPWVRTRVAFVDQRKINSFPPGACQDKKSDDGGQQNQATAVTGQADKSEPNDPFPGRSGDPDEDEEEEEYREDEPLLDPRFHYHASGRDFLVNMAGCEWGRDCWAEMYRYRELSKRLNRPWSQRWADWWRRKWRRLISKSDLMKKEQVQ